ncbi:Lrp/AsnC family transcriptional regulator [Heyndrickxia coagulans]|uniref:Lrp/AsnC family transcriptional regulator n=1 Tax=Heyndrickxia coagulans TaxID=1398 RepID=UPI001F1CC749|nr:Lrp/AsnC family transcriptional regulator [Heyndrickxia coagulans]
MDFIDEQIIHELKEDSRLSMSELSRRIHLSAPAVRERVRQLEEQDIIKRYTIELNQKKLGYPIEAIIEATIKNNRYDDFKKQICQYSNVDFCYRMSPCQNAISPETVSSQTIKGR